MKVITEAEFDSRWEESLEYEQIDCNIHGFDEIGIFKNEWSEGNYYFTDKLLGIEFLRIWNSKICSDSNCLVKHDDLVSLTSKFYLAGDHNVICPGIEKVAPEYSEQGGYNYLFYLPDIEEIEQFSREDRLYRVTIEINLDTIRNFLTELDFVPKQLQALIDRERLPRFHCSVGRITPTMKSIIRQIIDHPYHSAIARMYLQGKVWELLAMQLSQLTDGTDNQVTSIQLKPSEIELIYDAQKILVKNLDNSPYIQSIAQFVGMSDRKLQQGFKQLYGTTVFKYLQNYRLEQAQLMLREGNLSVATVANNIGYTHLGHFSAAFKRKFGMTPRDCLKGTI